MPINPSAYFQERSERNRLASQELQNFGQSFAQMGRDVTGTMLQGIGLTEQKRANQELEAYRNRTAAETERANKASELITKTHNEALRLNMEHSQELGDAQLDHQVIIDHLRLQQEREMEGNRLKVMQQSANAGDRAAEAQKLAAEFEAQDKLYGRAMELGIPYHMMGKFMDGFTLENADEYYQRLPDVAADYNAAMEGITPAIRDIVDRLDDEKGGEAALDAFNQDLPDLAESIVRETGGFGPDEPVSDRMRLEVENQIRTRMGQVFTDRISTLTSPETEREIQRLYDELNGASGRDAQQAVIGAINSLIGNTDLLKELYTYDSKQSLLPPDIREKAKKTYNRLNTLWSAAKQIADTNPMLVPHERVEDIVTSSNFHAEGNKLSDSRTAMRKGLSSLEFGALVRNREFWPNSDDMIPDYVLPVKFEEPPVDWFGNRNQFGTPGAYIQ